MDLDENWWVIAFGLKNTNLELPVIMCLHISFLLFRFRADAVILDTVSCTKNYKYKAYTLTETYRVT